MSISAGAVVVAQVIDRITDTAVGVWLLDHECAFEAYGTSAAACAVGDVVFCRLSADGRYMDKMLKIGRKTRAAYSSKILVV